MNGDDVIYNTTTGRLTSNHDTGLPTHLNSIQFYVCGIDVTGQSIGVDGNAGNWAPCSDQIHMPISISASPLFFGAYDAAGHLQIRGGVTGNGGEVHITGAGTVEFVDTPPTYYGLTTVDGGRLNLNTTLPGPVTVINGGELLGSGPVQSLVKIQSGTLTLLAGGPFVVMSSVDFKNSSTAALKVNINGPALYGQLQAANAVANLTNSQLFLQINGTPSLPPGSVLTIVQAASRSGQFANAVDGSVFTSGGYKFLVSYPTGQVVLTVPVAPGITVQPAGANAFDGQQVTFQAAATGLPAPTVQWQVRYTPVGGWADIPGATSTTLSLIAHQPTLFQQYRAVFTNVAGVTPTNPATLSVSDVAIAGLALINSSPTFLPAATTFTASITAGTNVVYQWDFGDGSPVVFTGSSATHTYLRPGSYTATVTASNFAGSSVKATQVVIKGWLYLPLLAKAPAGG